MDLSIFGSLNVIESMQSSCENSISQCYAESRGFHLDTVVSSQRESLLGGLGDTAHSNCHMLLWWPCPYGKALLE